MSRKENIWIYGKHAVVSAVENPMRKITRIMLTKDMHNEIKTLKAFRELKVRPEIVDGSRITAVVGKEAIHQGCAVLVSQSDKMDVKMLTKLLKDKKRSLIIALDHLTDPHNIGAIIRSAVAFGCDGIVTTKDNSGFDNPTVAKSASGGLEHINIVIASNLVMAFKELKEAGYWIIGMDMDTRYDISKIREYDKVVLVMGSEGQGLRRLTIESCDITMKIVMDPKMESLNVSNAAAIAMHMHTCQNI